MRPVPVPAEAAALGQVVTIGGDGCDPAEYLVTESQVYPGAPCFRVWLELSDEDRAAIASGARLMLALEGAEVPWGLFTVPAGQREAREEAAKSPG